MSRAVCSKCCAEVRASGDRPPCPRCGGQLLIAIKDGFVVPDMPDLKAIIRELVDAYDALGLLCLRDDCGCSTGPNTRRARNARANALAALEKQA